MNYPRLTKELVHEIGTLWRDSAIQVGRALSKWFRLVFTELSDVPIQIFDADWQETYFRGNELQLPDCANYFIENLQRLSDADYVPTKVCENMRADGLILPFYSLIVSEGIL